MYGHGYKLGEDAEGFGAGPVENELTPRLGRRGAMLGIQRETEADMFLPIIIRSTHAAEVRRLVAELTRIMNRADGTFRVILTDPETGESRYRDVAYKDGLETPDWRSPRAVKFTITADYMDPWAYSPPRTVTLLPSASEFEGGLVAPLIAPLVASGSSVPSAVAVENQGEQDAPIQVTFYGPSTNPRAWAGPVEVVYRGSLAWDEYVTINGKDHTVLLHGGGRVEPVPVPGRLSPHTLLTDLVVPVGVTHWWYEAIDPSLQSKAEFTWWDAYQSMQ
jgi:hypothetical protein